MEAITLTQHILQQQRLHPEARGTLTGLLTQLGVAAKIVASNVSKAGLLKMLGAQGSRNVHGEAVQKLDHVANRVFLNTLARSGYVCGIASEEEDSYYEPPEHLRGSYVVTIDPLDGSSNIDANISIGTIFGIFKKKSRGNEATSRDFLRPGREQIAAGYVMYGASTVFIYTTGEGVHGFVLDPAVGEFVLSDDSIQLPRACSCLSINDCNSPYWRPWTHRFISEVKRRNDADKRRINGRHIGSLVADFHRNLRYGGIFLYPEDSRAPQGKLRLLYEAFPLAMLMEQAGGSATDGRRRILDIVPEQLHSRTPLVIGNTEEVNLATRLVAEENEEQEF